MLRNTGRVDLGVARVSKIGTLTVSPPSSSTVTPHSVGGQEENIPITTGRQNNNRGSESFQFTSFHIASHNPARPTVRNDKFYHFVTGVRYHGARVDLTLQRLIGADQQLLTRLTPRIESTGNLHPTERAVI